MSEFPQSGTELSGMKHRLRAELLLRRQEFAIASLDAALLAALPQLLAGRRVVAGYVPLRREPGGAELPARVAALVDQLLLPVLRPDNDLDWTAWNGPLPPGPGLRAPTGPRLGVRAVTAVELLLVPALAVDRATGVRLGRGGGSYDRVLARLAPGTAVIALLYPGELREGVPAEPHDQRVTAVLTPTGLVEPGAAVI